MPVGSVFAKYKTGEAPKRSGRRGKGGENTEGAHADRRTGPAGVVYISEDPTKPGRAGKDDDLFRNPQVTAPAA